MDRFEPGDKALAIDSKGRRYMFTLQPGGSFHFHRGILVHDDILGAHDGVGLTSTGSEKVTIFHPTYVDFVLKMPRGAQVVYPKDAAMILIEGDIYPGARVLEAGAGSGALSIALLRAIGPQGELVTYELRDDFARIARANVESMLGKVENFEIRLGDVYQPIGDEVFDRAVLDLPEPWQVIPQLVECLRPGGILTCYLPTILQVHQLTRELVSGNGWTAPRTTETLVRSWHVTERSVRPDHRMVAHTGYLTVVRFAG
ncbi:MAG: tRNA (adenine-N1)-methyltransferase [Actinomycetota bacterium]